jgi:hypothetical protein
MLRSRKVYDGSWQNRLDTSCSDCDSDDWYDGRYEYDRWYVGRVHMRYLQPIALSDGVWYVWGIV